MQLILARMIKKLRMVYACYHFMKMDCNMQREAEHVSLLASEGLVATVAR